VKPSPRKLVFKSILNLLAAKHDNKVGREATKRLFSNSKSLSGVKVGRGSVETLETSFVPRCLQMLRGEGMLHSGKHDELYEICNSLDSLFM